MQLKSARQAWHDASYVSSSSTIARCAEIARLGTDVQNTAWHNSSNRAAHIAQAGLILQAIGTLPKHLQQLGDWLYAPLTTEQANWIVEDVQESIFLSSGCNRGCEVSYWLTRAVMRDYQDLVLDRRMRLQTPHAIRSWLADWHGVDIDTRRWVRHWKPVWKRLWTALDDLDAQALKPVARVIEKSKEKKIVPYRLQALMILT